MDPSPSRRRLLSTSICPLNDQGETPWDPPLLVADVFTADFICSLNDQGETPWDPSARRLHCRLQCVF